MNTVRAWIGLSGSRNKSEVLPGSDDLQQSVCSQKTDRPSKVVRKERKPGLIRYLDLSLGQQIVGPVPSLYSPIWMLHDGVALSQMLLVWIKPKNYDLLPRTLAWRYRDWSERKICSARDQSTGCSLIKCFLFSDLTLLEGSSWSGQGCHRLLHFWHAASLWYRRSEESFLWPLFSEPS